MQNSLNWGIFFNINVFILKSSPSSLTLQNKYSWLKKCYIERHEYAYWFSVRKENFFSPPIHHNLSLTRPPVISPLLWLMRLAPCSMVDVPLCKSSLWRLRALALSSAPACGLPQGLAASLPQQSPSLWGLRLPPPVETAPVKEYAHHSIE